MDYKQMVLNLLEKASEKQIKNIYYFLNGFLCGAKKQN